MAGKEENEKVDDLTGVDKVYDQRNKLPNSKLYTGTCDMSGCSFNIMIKKDPGLKKETYNVMRNFQHNTVIPHLNFYTDSNHGRLVIPLVGSSFEYWIKNEGQGQLVDQNGAMTPLFKAMIVDICDAVDKLRLHGILIKNLSESNLYMAKEVAPRILLLVTDAEEIIRDPSNVQLWSPIQGIVRWCYAACNAQPNCHAQRYIQFISSGKFTVKSLKNYPENWDDFTKGEYMLAVIAASRSYIKAAVRGAGVFWPANLPDELENVLKHYREQNPPCHYKKTSQFDYINLIRDLYKHFDKLPSYIKASLGGSQEVL